MIQASEREQLADKLMAAQRDRVPIDPLTTTCPGFDVVDAYEIQLINVRRRIGAGGTIRGHKVGLSARAMQQMMGVNEPDYGHLLDDMFVFETDRVSADTLCQPRVEVEVAFVLGAPLSGPGSTVADVLAATAFVVPAIEIIDSRIRDWKIRLPDTVADNASSGLVVLGGRRSAVEGTDLRTLGAVLRRNGEIAETGAAGAVLGNPATAVAWLANKVHAFGVELEAGHIVMPGSCTRAIDVRAGDVVRADFDVLGHVAVSFA
jgi:2-keto-4-pentenoate hydratase